MTSLEKNKAPDCLGQGREFGSLDSEINEIKVDVMDVGEECLSVSSQSKLGFIRCHIACRADIVIAWMDTLIDLIIYQRMALTFPVMQREVLVVFSDNVQGRQCSDSPTQWASSGSPGLFPGT